jgi:hypothetical protein
VINRLDENVVIKSRFKYTFGFSAEVTLMGLEELTKMREVISINKDHELHLDMQQSLSLMNATAVRSIYNGE